MNKLHIIMIMLSFTLDIGAQKGEYVGGDISMLPAYEEHNSGYLDENGRKIDDLLKWFVDECKWNIFRVRLFVNPDNSDHSGVIQDIEYVKRLGKRIKDTGAKFLLDLHYSDTWSDPGKQNLPSAWSGCINADQKAEKLYTYTKETLSELKEYGANPDIVQVGNEITAGIVGVWRNTDPTGFKKIVEKGCDAVRESCPDAKVLLHIESPQNTSTVIGFYNTINESKYDIIGLSYYPIWHYSLNELSSTLNAIYQSFPSKKVFIVETAYNFQKWPEGDVTWDSSSIWPCTANGQYNFIKDLIRQLSNHENVNGLLYWFPEEAGNGDDTDWSKQPYGTVLATWLNRGLWWVDKKSNGHWPVKSDFGLVHYIFKDFLSPEALNITHIGKSDKHDGNIYNIKGQRISTSTHNIFYIYKGKKYVAK